MSSTSTALVTNNKSANNYVITSSNKKSNINNNNNNEMSMNRSNTPTSSLKTSMNNISIHSNDSGLSSFTSPNHSSSIPSPTISLISSSSSSPSSASSSPISNLLSNSSQNSNTLNNSLNKLVGLSSDSAKKSAALSNISATIAKYQKNQLNNNIVPKTKVSSSNHDVINSGAVSCSIVKSNTNIYYNSKVETAASKAIHYCNHCTNINCKAIHKSLTKPLIAHSQPLQLTSTPLLSTSLLSSNTPNRSNSSSSSSSSSSTRIFLSPQQLQSNQQSQPQQIQVSNVNNNQSSQNNQFNKLLGANINFIFERRYPLVQLNSNLFNTAISGTSQPLQSPTNESASLTSALNQLATQSLPNQQQQHQQHQRHALKYSGHRGSDLTHHRFSLSDENDSTQSPPLSFPLPLSQQQQQQSTTPTSPLSPNKPSTFSINFNRLLSSNTPQATSSVQRRQLLNSQNQQLLQQINEAIENHNLNNSLSKKNQPFSTSDLIADLDSVDDDNAQNMSNNPMFPINSKNLNLRYKNIMFLDQVNTK